MVTMEKDEDEHDSKERVLQRCFLQEWKVVRSLIDDIVSSGRVSDPSVVNEIRIILDKYQEQGQLLEPYLESIVCPLMRLVRSKTIEIGVSSNEILDIIKPLCTIIYVLVTVCGYKAVVNFFPHHVSNLELAVSLLEKCHCYGSTAGTSLRQESTGEMEASCIVLLWLYILVLVPFDISSIDSSLASGNTVSDCELPPIVSKILEFSKSYLSNAGPMRTISALLLSRLLSRPDMSVAFTRFIGWTHEILSSGRDDTMTHFQYLGALEALSAIFKVSDRKMLMDVISTTWNDVLSLVKTGVVTRSPLLCKYQMKLTQRMALACLPLRPLSWHYVSKISLLGTNLSTNPSKIPDDCSHEVNIDSMQENFGNLLEDNDMDVPDIVDEVMEVLLVGLRDKDTVVRWSAAKGIGRITSRLTPSLAEEVLAYVVELFSPLEGDGAWHGACLALAELARRGLLLPTSLPNVVPFIVKALHCDIRRGPHSVGAHVRDAAAYVCWAFGRAYSNADMRSILSEFVPHLLTVACYDREVNCRRAAAAAFQENVGRQGSYPNGIEIINAADYFSLSSRVNAYLHVSIHIAQYEGYLHPFAEELLNKKICHWEKGLRELASEALAALVKYDPMYFESSVLEKLIPSTLSADICVRHGSTLAVAEVVLALHHCHYNLSAGKQKDVCGIVCAIEKARLYRGKGGEMMRSAVSRLIECIALCPLPLSEKIALGLLDTINENLRHPNSQIQNAAIGALKPFVRAYLLPAGNCDDAGGVTSKYLEQLSDQNVAVRRGSALALGVLPYALLAHKWRDVVLKLCSSCEIEDDPETRDVEARVNAIRGLVSLCQTLTQEKLASNLPIYDLIKEKVMGSLFKALDDYSVDNRGDVGSWVREAAMEGIEVCAYLLCAVSSPSTSRLAAENDEATGLASFFDENMATVVVRSLAKQAVEKIDRLREAAATILQRILHSKNILVNCIPFRDKLEQILPFKADLLWSVPAMSYTCFVQLLEFPCYSKAVMSGLVISIGGLQDSLRKASVSALLGYLKEHEVEASQESPRGIMLCLDILWVLQQYKGCDRVIVPTFKTIEILFSKNVIYNMEDFYFGVLDSIDVELKRTKEFAKLNAGIAMLGYMSTIATTARVRAFQTLLKFLSHRYPKIRMASAEQVYLALLQDVTLVADGRAEEAMEILSEHLWDGDLASVKLQQSKLLQLAGLALKPLAAVADPHKNVLKKLQQQLQVADENASYGSLVDSAGF